MRVIVLLTIGFVLFGAPAVGQETPPTEGQASADKPVMAMSDDELLDLASRYADIGRFAEARAALRIVLGRNDRNLEALQRDGEYALKTTPSDVQGARLSFLAALKIQPAEFRANYGLAQTWFRTRSWRQAQIYLETAAKTAPSDKVAELNAMLAQCYRANGLKPEAYAAVEKAIAADPSGRDAREVKIALLTSDRKYDQALIEADALVDLNRDAVRVAADKREALVRLHGAHNIRLSVLQEMRTIFFQITPAGELTERIVEGREREAAAVVKRVMEDLIVLNDLNRTIQYFTIIAFAEQAVKIAPGDSDAWLKLGMLYRNTYQDQAAANIMARVLQLDPENEAAKRELETLPPPTNIATIPSASQPAGVPESGPATSQASVP